MWFDVVVAGVVSGGRSRPSKNHGVWGGGDTSAIWVWGRSPRAKTRESAEREPSSGGGDGRSPPSNQNKDMGCASTPAAGGSVCGARRREGLGGGAPALQTSGRGGGKPPSENLGYGGRSPLWGYAGREPPRNNVHRTASYSAPTDDAACAYRIWLLRRRRIVRSRGWWGCLIVATLNELRLSRNRLAGNMNGTRTRKTRGWLIVD